MEHGTGDVQPPGTSPRFWLAASQKDEKHEGTMSDRKLTMTQGMEGVMGTGKQSVALEKNISSTFFSES